MGSFRHVRGVAAGRPGAASRGERHRGRTATRPVGRKPQAAPAGRPAAAGRHRRGSVAEHRTRRPVRVLVLRSLSDSVTPGPEAIGREPILRKVASYARCRVADGELDVVVTGVSVHRAGFTAHIEARFRSHRVRRMALVHLGGDSSASPIPTAGSYVARPLEQTLTKEVWPWSRGWRDDGLHVHAVHSTRPDRDLQIAVRRDLLVPADDAGRSACPAARAQPRANRVA